MFKVLLTCFHAFSIFVFHHQAPIHHYKLVRNHDISANVSPTPTPIISGTPSLYVTDSPTPTLEPTATVTPTPVVSGVPSVTPTTTPTPTVTLSETPIPTTTPMPTSEASPTPTVTPTMTPTVSPTPTSTLPTETPIPTTTPTPTPTATPSPTISLIPTDTPTPTLALTPTASSTPTVMLSPTPSSSEGAEQIVTPTPTPTVTPTIDPSDPPMSPTPTLSPTPTPAIKIGNDISYPQCGQTLPTGQGFGIVGINDGIATTTNPCLSTELLWAQQSLGTQNQAKVQVYVNTGNPGTAGQWPNNNVDPVGNTASNPYGTCDGSISDACAWQYGWNRAVDDVQNKFVPAAQAAGVDTTPSDYPLWLDVETVNSWDSGSSDALQRNREDLEAMVTYFQSRGITVGLYSTSFMWSVIVGSVPSNSNLNGLRSWLPGAADVNGAQSNCSLSSLTSGGSVTVTQYSTNNFDYDYSCL